MFEEAILNLLKTKELSYKDLLSLVKEDVLDIDTAENILDIYTNNILVV